MSGTTSGGSSFKATASWKQDTKSYKATPSFTSFAGPPFTGQVALGETVFMNFHQITLDVSTDAGLVVTGPETAKSGAPTASTSSGKTYRETPDVRSIRVTATRQRAPVHSHAF